jgi:membrane protein required for colicin V production
MTWVDWCIVGLGALSGLLGILRGFFREVATLVVWGFALLVAVQFGELLADSLVQYISLPSIRIAAGYAILFIGVLIVGAIITHFVVEMIRRSMISGTDRALGGLFGVARALVIGGFLVLIASKTVVRQDSWWKQSLTIPVLETVAGGIAVVMPPQWVDAITPRPLPQPTEAAAPPVPAGKGT